VNGPPLYKTAPTPRDRSIPLTTEPFVILSASYPPTDMQCLRRRLTSLKCQRHCMWADRRPHLFARRSIAGAMTRSGDVKSFFRQQKAHAKPTGGVSKRASVHHQKAAPAVLAHSVLPGIIPDPTLLAWILGSSLAFASALTPSIDSFRFSRQQITAPVAKRKSGRRGSSTWTCGTGPASASPRRRPSSRSAPTTRPASGKDASKTQQSDLVLLGSSMRSALPPSTAPRGTRN
jgi:hypothetical protein